MLGLRSARPPAVVAVLAVGALMLGTGSATAGHVTDPRTKNLHPMGHIEEPASLLTGPPTIHTDIAFWGKTAVQGNWLGCNIRDLWRRATRSRSPSPAVRATRAT
jgi:hypothetical protein